MRYRKLGNTGIEVSEIGFGCVEIGIPYGIGIENEGERNFVAAGAVVNKDVPPRSLVLGVPGCIQKLPDKLDRPNNRECTCEAIDIWHPLTKDPSVTDWPEDWGERFS